jgi:hypothetical protein
VIQEHHDVEFLEQLQEVMVLRVSVQLIVFQELPVSYLLRDQVGPEFARPAKHTGFNF